MISVAIIEDLATYRNAMEVLLNGSTGYHCCGAFDSAETALRSLPVLKADVALVDIHLPGMSGIQLVKCIREMIPDTLCMMCTAYDQDDDVFQALQSGAHGYILKSTPPVKILEAIQELKNGGSPMSNEIARKVVMTFQQSSVDRAEFDLTRRETETLTLLSQGLLYKEIALRLSVTLDTVRRHCFNIYTKLHVNNRTEAINKYFGNRNH